MPSARPSLRPLLLALPVLLATASGCKREFDSPPVHGLPVGSVVDIAQLKAMYQGTPVHFSDTTGAVNTLYAVVTADEQNGNLYKNVYVQDQTGALCLRLLNSGGLYQGDSIRIYLPGTVLSPYNGLMQLDSVDVDNNVVKQAVNVSVAPTPASISALITDAGPGGNLQGKLVLLSGVQFTDSSGQLTWADPIGQQSLNRDIQDCNGNATIVRSSGYANFAGQNLPVGKGSFTGIASWFGSAPQLLIRNINEVQMNGPRCGSAADCTPLGGLSEDFSLVTANASVGLACWINARPVGSRDWVGKVDGSLYCAEARPVSFDAANEMWLATPAITYAPGMQLTFQSSHSQWQHDGLTVWISTNVTDGDLSTGDWTQLNSAIVASQANATDEWVGSGAVDLGSSLPSGFSGTFVVAFKYTGSYPASETTAYRIDQVEVN